MGTRIQNYPGPDVPVINWVRWLRNQDPQTLPVVESTENPSVARTKAKRLGLGHRRQDKIRHLARLRRDNPHKYGQVVELFRQS